jgi:tetratricopeptide (TPR) repeat protein
MRTLSAFLLTFLVASSTPALSPEGTWRDPDPAARAQQQLDHAAPEVLADIEAALADGKANPLPLVEYGYGEALAGRADTARDSYMQALEVSSIPYFERRVRWSFGWALLHLDAAEEAMEQWQIAADLHHGRPFWVPYSMAVAQWSAGRRDEALRWYQVAVDSFPERWSSEDAMATSTRLWKAHERGIVEAVFGAWNESRSGPAELPGDAAR